LAYDLESYEQDNYWRKEDPSFFGDAQAKSSIRSALAQLRSAGVAVDKLELTETQWEHPLRTSYLKTR